MAIIDTIKVIARTIFKPSTAWAFLFFPALFYYTGTRLYSLGLFRSSTYGAIVDHGFILIRSTHSSVTPSSYEAACSKFLSSNKNTKEKLFYMQSHNDCSSLRYSIHLVQDFEEGSVVSTTWMEDEELGRGYLLLSTSAGNGKVYRWEAGGGPIAIGRTLHLKDSGCRSNSYQQCGTMEQVGSGGIAVDTFRSESSPTLIVAEYGEGRVVRMEENGARTPLIIDTTNQNTQGGGSSEEKIDSNRLTRPFRLLVTPYGDLMVMDDATAHGNGFVLWRLHRASHVPGLPSLMVSREAHQWNRNNHTVFPHVFFESGAMGGMVLEPSGQGIYVTAMDPDSSSVVVMSFPLLEDLDDMEITDEGEEENGKEQNTDSNENKDEGPQSLRLRHGKLLFDYTAHANAPGAIEIDNNGNLYLAVDNGILVVSKSKEIVAKISFSIGEKIADLTLGSDKFLYIAMQSKLARVQVPNSPLEIRKDLLIKA